MSTDAPHDQPQDPDPSISSGEAPQAMGMFTETTGDDVKLDPDTPAFDRVQDGKKVDQDYEREYNRRYVKEHGDHQGPSSEGPETDRQP